LARKTERILVTGATGQIGSDLTLELRKSYGDENVVAAWYDKKPEGTLGEGPFEWLDVTDARALRACLEQNNIGVVYHLAGLLSAIGERNPQLTWHVNVDGLHSVLKAGVELGLRIFWPSSMAVFGDGVPRDNAPQEAVLAPSTIYGASKVAGELLCRYYYNKFGLDVRCVRYPGIISYKALPGGGTTDYAVEIFYEAIKHGRYTCFVSKETVLPMMYMPDAVKAAMDLMNASGSQVVYRMGYNIAAFSFSAEELANEIRKHVPRFRCEYKPDFRQKIADSWPMALDDSLARAQWGWRPSYDLAAMTSDMIERLTERLRGRAP